MLAHSSSRRAGRSTTSAMWKRRRRVTQRFRHSARAICPFRLVQWDPSTGSNPTTPWLRFGACERHRHHTAEEHLVNTTAVPRCLPLVGSAQRQPVICPDMFQGEHSDTGSNHHSHVDRCLIIGPIRHSEMSWALHPAHPLFRDTKVRA